MGTGISEQYSRNIDRNEGNMKKIVFLIHDLMGGGAEKVLVNMVNNLNPEKYDITVMTVFDEGVHRNSLKENIHYKYFLKKSFNGNKYFFRSFTPEFWYRKVFGNDKYDIVVSYLEGTCARIASGCKDAKKVAWIHRERDENGYKVCFKNKKEADEVYSSFDRIVCVAESLKDNFVKFCPAFKDAEVLYNVNETDKIMALSEEPVDEKGLFDDGVPTISFIGKVIREKGIYRLADIHKRLNEENIPHRFLIMGVGEDSEPVKAILKENGSEKDFVFLGFQKNPYKYLAKSDMFVCASFAEGFSTATTEALILGLPVVVADCSGMNEMLCGNEYGIITENNDDALYEGLKKMLTDSELREDYARKAAVRGKDFLTEKSIERIEKFFDEL